MNELVSIFLPSMILVFFSEHYSRVKIDCYGEKKYIKKDKIFYVIMSLSMVAFVGLRTWYNDTVTYLHHYNNININESILEKIDWSLGENPGFELVNVFLKKNNVSDQTFLMMFALFTICIYLWFIRKYSSNIWLSVFLFFSMGCYTFTMAAIKQTTAVAICLIAVDKAINRKWMLFIFGIIIAATFHPYALMYLIIPFFCFKPWSQKTNYMLIIFAVIGVSLQKLLGSIVNLTQLMGEEYSLDTLNGAGVNIFRVMVVWAPIFLSFLAKDSISKYMDKENSLWLNLSMINAEIMFVALFGTANYFARLANYFLIFQTISLPYLLKYFNKKTRKLLIGIIIVAYLLYFIYANLINQPFDDQFNKISLFDYLYSLRG